MDVTKTTQIVRPKGVEDASYFTRVGQLGYGDDVNKELPKVIQFRHDIMLRAAREKLDVAILSGALRAELQSVLTPKYTEGRTFAQSIAEVCEAGNRVRILIWNEAKPKLIDPAIARLVNQVKERRAREPQFRGDLEIRISGIEQGWEQVSHFVLAYDPRFVTSLRDGRATSASAKFRLRIESPHPSPADMDEPVSPDDELPAVISFFPPPPEGNYNAAGCTATFQDTGSQLVDGGLTARDYSPKLLTTFEALWSKAMPVHFAGT